MPRFSYTAIDATGAQVSGHVLAEDDLSALDAVAARGLTPLDLTEGGRIEPWWSRDIRLGRGSSEADPAEQERFFATLAAMLEARLPLPRALGFCADQTRDRTFRAALEEIRNAVENGQSLGKAMSSVPNAFPEHLIRLVTLGERSDALAVTAARIAVTLQAEAAMRGSLRSALIYPAILMGMSLMVLALVVFYLAPTLLPVFETAGAEPPAVLAVMDALRRVLLAAWPVLLIGGAAIALAIAVLRTRMREAFSGLFLGLPVTGGFVRRIETERLCRSLLLMLASGASLPVALRSARESIGHPRYRTLIEETEADVAAGGRLSATLCRSPLIDAFAKPLIEAGEESDSLSTVLETAVTTLATRNAEAMGRALRLLTPLLTLAIGIGVGAIILSTITAIMDLNDVAF